MKFSEFFKSKDTIQLDKKTLVILRWIALVGQYLTINAVYFVFKFELPFLYCSLIIFFGVITNFYLQFKFKKNQLNNFTSTFFFILRSYSTIFIIIFNRWYNKSFCNFINCSIDCIINFFKFEKYNKFVHHYNSNFISFNNL